RENREARGSREVLRFDAVERAVHWSTAVLVLTLIATGAILYVPSLALAIGHRAIVEQVHVVSGLAMFGPLLVGVAGPWRQRLLGDIRRFDTWTREDWAWFHISRARRLAGGRGKFNGGQKAEAVFIAGAMLAMLVTGIVMRWSPPFSNHWATGATFIHDWGFVAIGAAITAHIAFALSRPDQFRAIFTGRIPRHWAKVHAPTWLAELDESGEAQRPSSRSTSSECSPLRGGGRR
ncbi:MAG: cytochrome b/b6 domain-containing protein, partial [Acidimicrobiales bacterium]